MAQSQRRHPRVDVALDITLEAAGKQWQGKTVDLSPYGVKVAARGQSPSLPPGTSVRLRFPPCGQDPPLSLPATVVRTDSDGVSLSFDGLETQQSRNLRDLIDSLVMREWRQLLDQLGSEQSSDAQARTLTQPVTAPRVHEVMPPVASGVKSNGTDASGPDAGEEIERGRPEGPSVPLSEADSEREKWQELLAQVGLDSICFPSNGVLCPQWRNFLNQLAPTKNKTGKSKTK